jgi:hypothetical protein
MLYEAGLSGMKGFGFRCILMMRQGDCGQGGGGDPGLPTPGPIREGPEEQRLGWVGARRTMRTLASLSNDSYVLLSCQVQRATRSERFKLTVRLHRAAVAQAGQTHLGRRVYPHRTVRLGGRTHTGRKVSHWRSKGAPAGQGCSCDARAGGLRLGGCEPSFGVQGSGFRV